MNWHISRDNHYILRRICDLFKSLFVHFRFSFNWICGMSVVWRCIATKRYFLLGGSNWRNEIKRRNIGFHQILRSVASHLSHTQRCTPFVLGQWKIFKIGPSIQNWLHSAWFVYCICSRVSCCLNHSNSILMRIF